MKIKLSQNDFKKLMKETIEDVALANAIDKGLKSKPVSPKLKLNTNLVLKAEIEFLESFFDRADGVRPRVDDDGGAVVLGRDVARAELHITMRQRRAVLHHQNALAFDGRCILHAHR